MKFKTITLIGLGLMGGSLAAACRRRFPSARIVAVSRNRGALAEARRKKWIHEGTTDLKQGVKDADLIVLCTPVQTFQALLSLIDRFAKPGALVTDVGSVKGEILSWASKRKFRSIQFVGAHPMAGSHDRGFQAANGRLYDKSFVFLVRSPKSAANSFSTVKKFWQKIAARVVEVSPQAHDRIVAEISHLPHAVAVCLMLTPAPASARFAAGGFLDSTRIAQGHPTIWQPIFQANKKEFLRAFAEFEKRCREFKRALSRSGDRKLAKILADAGRRRSQISL